MHQFLECVDAGSDYCPCYLAETEDCIMCSQLQGEVFCDCQNWKGVCIYQEFVSNRQHRKEGRMASLYKILDRKQVADGVFLLTIQVGYALARELNRPGAYVFIRHHSDPTFFDAPMSIMDGDEQQGTITLALQTKGVKTKSLLDLGETIMLRGPYVNGLLGLKYLYSVQGQATLVVARGIAQAPALPVARKLIQQGNSVHLILDPGRNNLDFAVDSFVQMGCTITKLPLFDPKELVVPPDTLLHVKQHILTQDVKLVYSGGVDILHTALSRLIGELSTTVHFTCSNDASFCCGEGICGSCHTRLDTGSRIKTCKTQIKPQRIFGGR